MNDRRRIETVRMAAGRLGLLAAKLDANESDTTLLGRMRDAQGGPAAQRLDAQRSGPAISDPTYTAAFRPDVAARDLAELDRICNQVVALVEKAWDIVDRYPPPRRANEADRLALARLNGRVEPGCENCSRIEGPAGPRWEPVRADLAAPTDAGGRLDEPKLLCDWCFRRVRDWGRLPSATELERHHRGERVPWPRDVPKPG